MAPFLSFIFEEEHIFKNLIMETDNNQYTEIVYLKKENAKGDLDIRDFVLLNNNNPIKK